MIAWMAHCTNDDCGAFDSSTASWFKIGQRGLQSGTIETGDWFQKTFSNWDGNPSLWSETVPRNLKPGKYLVRHEIISLHSANKPQFYPECAHVEVSGEGVGEPGQEYLVRIPGVWNMDSKCDRRGDRRGRHTDFVLQCLRSILMFMRRGFRIAR